MKRDLAFKKLDIVGLFEMCCHYYVEILVNSHTCKIPQIVSTGAHLCERTFFTIAKICLAAHFGDFPFVEKRRDRESFSREHINVQCSGRQTKHDGLANLKT